MEIAKFVLSCIGSFIAVSGFFMGIWKAYSKKTDDKIKAIQAQADEKNKRSRSSRAGRNRQGTGRLNRKIRET